MVRIGILGNIGSGKSYVANNLGYPVFNADYEVTKLYKNNKKIFLKLNKILPKNIKSFPIEKKEITEAILQKKNNLKKIIKFENVKIDLSKQIIFRGGLEFKINNTEKTILDKMINNPGKVFEREEIGKLIDLDKERSIDVIITRLRKKIEIDPKNPKFLQTIRGAGYVLWIE